MKKYIIILSLLVFASLRFPAWSAGGEAVVDEAALKEAEASGDVRETIKQLVICGNAWFDAGDTDKARDYCCRAFSLMKDSSDASLIETSFTISNSLFTIARIYRKNNNPDKALEYLERSIKFEQALSRSHMISRRYEEKIEILIDEHRYDEAMAAVQELRDDAALRRNSQHYISKSYYLEGLCREVLGDTAGAEASIEKAVEWADKIYYNSNHVDLPVFLNKLARYSIAKGDTVAATGYYRRAMGIIDSFGNKVLNQDVCNGLADIYAESDPQLSAEYRHKAQKYDYLPELENLASKIAIDSIDFP
ncbi:MAG: hypothetical protein MJY56_04130 [Bacteroidales bacterium]|nr:hypothetical protein [Bacteroidales bacterium]